MSVPPPPPRKKIVFRRPTAPAADPLSLPLPSPTPTPTPSVDRAVFASVHFSAPSFVDSVARRALSAPSAPSSAPPLFSSSLSPPSPSSSPSPSLSSSSYLSGGRLAAALDAAAADAEAVRRAEAAALRRLEVRCRRVEIREKRRLAALRVGLESATAKLHAYENRVCNALAATAGVEEHLAQSNARVMRGKSVSMLLRYFKMFTRMQEGELAAVMRNLSKARAEQRGRVTAQWETGNVSAFDPMYYGAPASGRGGGEMHADGEERREGEIPRGEIEEEEEEGRGKGKGGKLGIAVGKGKVEEEAAEEEEYEDDDDDDDDEVVEEEEGKRRENKMWRRKQRQGKRKGRTEKMHRLETAAVAMGLEKVFAVRSEIEAQVEWCQKLTHLIEELKGVVGNTKNVELYVGWLREEIVADAFHLIDCFNELYAARPDTAAHQPFGRALLKTLELVSRLYTTITPTHGALLQLFYARSTNDMGVKLISEFTPKPLSVQPTLATVGAQPSAMRHFNTNTLPDLKRTFDFIIARARRDVIIVETLFGTTNSARQQLLARITDNVVKPLVTQQLKLVEFFERGMIEAESQLSPRSKRRAAPHVADAIAYTHNMQSSLFGLFQSYVTELRGIFDRGDVDFLSKYSASIFTGRAAYAQGRAELELLRRYQVMLEEQYTRDLHPVPEEFFDLREAHMRKTNELIERFTEVTARVQTYALPKDAAGYTMDLVKISLENMGRYLDTELAKTMNSIRADRDNWRTRVRNESDLLHPSTTESHQCGLRMLLFVQSSLISLSEAVEVSLRPFTLHDARLSVSVEDAKESAFEALDTRAEALLNLCAGAIIVRSLSILQHYQAKQDYMPKVARGEEGEMLAQPCTRACTLFCHYVSRQFEEAKEFIRLSNGQLPQRHAVTQLAALRSSTHANNNNKRHHPQNNSNNNNNNVSPYNTSRLGNGHHQNNNNNNSSSNNNNNHNDNMEEDIVGHSVNLYGVDVAQLVQSRAHAMNLQQLLYGDGGPSSFVRTIGVCLYRGIASHLKTFTVNDRGALIYKQDVTAYMEAMRPLIRTPGLGGAIVDILFRLLRETASLLLMPWEHIKGVRETGLLQLMSGEEKVRFIKMREDVRDGFRIIKA